MNSNISSATAALEQLNNSDNLNCLDPLDDLGSGIEALNGESHMLANDVLAYLKTHPEFFSTYSDSLAQLSLPAQKDGNVISMANWQTQVLRDKADQHKAHLEQLVQQASHNQRSHDKLFSLVSRWLSVVNAADLPKIIEQDLRQKFSLDAVQVMVWDEIRRINYYPLNKVWSDSIAVFSNSLRVPYCGACKGFEIETALAAQSPTGAVASLAIIPFWGERHRIAKSAQNPNPSPKYECIGVLMFGSADDQRFTHDMGTQFLQHIGQMVGSALSRLSEPVATATATAKA